MKIGALLGRAPVRFARESGVPSEDSAWIKASPAQRAKGKSWSADELPLSRNKRPTLEQLNRANVLGGIDYII